MARGTLFLIVGPSGAGKDTLLHGAHAALAGDGRFVFARRAITRRGGAGGEPHEEIAADEFELRRDGGAFLLSWTAHGLGYGLPAALGDDLAAGRHVIANVSRSVIADAAARFPPVRVVVVTAPPTVLAHRLAGRGRETEADITARLAREGERLPAGVPRIEIVNDAAPEDGVRKLVAALTDEAAR